MELSDFWNFEQLLYEKKIVGGTVGLQHQKCIWVFEHIGLNAWSDRWILFWGSGNMFPLRGKKQDIAFIWLEN